MHKQPYKPVHHLKSNLWKLNTYFCKIFLPVLIYQITTIVANAQSLPEIYWEKTLGGNKNDDITFIQQTADGSYLAGGFSESGKSKDKASAGFGLTDYWVFKLNSNGDLLWEKTFGGNDQDICNVMVRTPDGGCILGGSSKSDRNEHKSQPSAGNYDFWIIRLDAEGNKMWDRTLGGTEYDFLYSLQQTPDGGILLGGYSESGISGDKTITIGQAEFWIVKLDEEGNKLWDKTLGEADSEALYTLKPAKNGGYYLGGGSPKTVTNPKQQPRTDEFRVTYFDENGSLLWEKSLGGNRDDYLTALQPTPDGGCIIGGVSTSGNSRDKSQPSQGQGDFWIVKLDSLGNKQWDKTFGGTGFDYLSALEHASDGGYILGGISTSPKGSDKTHNNQGKTDFWVLRINAAGEKLWDETYGGTNDDSLYTIAQTSDGGYIVGGISDSEESGNKKNQFCWRQRYMAPETERHLPYLEHSLIK